MDGIRRGAVACLAALAVFGGPVIAADRVKIVLQNDPARAEATAPWVAQSDITWDSGAPTFAIAEKTVRLSAEGWIAVTGEYLLLRLDVSDPVHINEQTGTNIWNGDFVRVSIDGRGDAAGLARPRVAGVFGPDDASIGLALTPSGPQAWVSRAGATANEGAYSTELLEAKRDDAAKKTTYRLKVPWTWLHTPVGTQAQFGIVVQVRDVQKADQAEPVHIHWGDGADGPVPGLFQRVAIGNPPGPVTAAGVVREAIWEGQPAEIVFAVGGNGQTLDVQAQFNGTTTAMQVPPGEGIRRYSVTVHPEALPAKPVPCTLTISASARNVASTVAQVVNAGAAVEELRQKLAEMEKTADDPLLRRTVHGAALVLEDDWRKTQLAAEVAPESIGETLGHAQRILKELTVNPPTAQQIRNGERSVVVAFVSGADRTLQMCQIRLPREFDPEETYPLVVYLHGHGNGHPLSFLGDGLALGAASTPKYAEDRFITVLPWGRGNYGYCDIGETDVREAMHEARRLFKTDADRTYLTGFSMGGGGTWALAHSMPDVWAAACIQAGGPWFLPAGQGYSQNVRGLPIMIWHGTTDGAVAVGDAYAMQRELELFGNIPAVTLVPGRGHWVESADSDEILHWLLQHTRKRPNQFSVVCTPEQNGAWGIRLGYSMEPRRQFTCTIDANVVRISSTRVGRMVVDLGPQGLGMSGDDVKVYWNTRLRYAGRATEVELPWEEVDAPRQ